MNKKFLKIFVVLIVLILLVLSGVLLYIKNKKISGNSKENVSEIKYFSNEKASIDKYTLYGNHFNFSGILKINSNEINKTNSILTLIMEDLSDKTYETLDLKYTYEDNIVKFYTSEKINNGIDLEKVSIGNYKLYLKLKNFTTGLDTYYNFENVSEYGSLEYYTLTKNNSNNKINIDFSSETLNISCAQETLPENVYDVVIDPGHGGTSTGTMHFGYIESEINYDVSVNLKKSLEKLGLKVLLTRNSKDETVGNYDENGRAVVPNKVKAKLCLSIHNNSSPINPNSKGVEIYAPNFADLTFANSLAENIIEMAGSSYSPNTVGRVNGAVYVLKFDDKTIEECLEEANEFGYEPYKMSTETNMFFMIREVGGICTGAYIDGRDENTGNNPYVNSNCVCESYLLELGYVSNKSDIENVINNMDKYTDAITKSVKDHFDL